MDSGICCGFASGCLVCLLFHCDSPPCMLYYASSCFISILGTPGSALMGGCGEFGVVGLLLFLFSNPNLLPSQPYCVVGAQSKAEAWQCHRAGWTTMQPVHISFIIAAQTQCSESLWGRINIQCEAGKCHRAEYSFLNWLPYCFATFLCLFHTSETKPVGFLVVI